MDRSVIRHSATFSPEVIEDIQTKAELGHYRIRGWGTLKKVPNFDDLTFIPSSLSRVPLEGYREKCVTRTVLGTRRAARPLVLETPITITGMSYGALSRNAKVALGLAATRVGTLGRPPSALTRYCLVCFPNSQSLLTLLPFDTRRVRRLTFQQRKLPAAKF